MEKRKYKIVHTDKPKESNIETQNSETETRLSPELSKQLKT